MGVKMGWIQIKMGHPLARNGAALAPFRANGAHPSTSCWVVLVCVPCSCACVRIGRRKGSCLFVLLFDCAAQLACWLMAYSPSYLRHWLV